MEKFNQTTEESSQNAAAAPAESIPVREYPAETAPAEETPIEAAPAEETPVEAAPAEETPAETSGEEDVKKSLIHIEPCEAPSVLPELEKQEPITLFHNGLTGFGITQQGKSHIEKGNIPCQDSMDLRLLQTRPIILAAVADGVGSCQLSHYGSRTAVHTALDVLESRLEELAAHEDFDFNNHQQMQGLMLEAFRAALNAVDAQAAEMKQIPYAFQSTLTVTVYDGAQLYIGHAGDDGVVALAEDGTCTMQTRRHKGETANSVYPLQARNMDFAAVDKKVAAFALMTDGVLDAVVDSELYQNRVYYPFFKQFFETVLVSKDEVRELCCCADQMLAGKEYRERVTDDLSLVVVTNQAMLVNCQKPNFSMDDWNKQTAAISQKIQEQLYPKDPPKPRRKAPEHPQAPAQKPYTSQAPVQSLNRPQAPAKKLNNPQTPAQSLNHAQTPAGKPTAPRTQCAAKCPGQSRRCQNTRPLSNRTMPWEDCYPTPQEQSNAIILILQDMHAPDALINMIHTLSASGQTGYQMLKIYSKSLHGQFRDFLCQALDRYHNSGH